ncbi:heme NO-binding domain-containing protein [Sulfurimonas sp. SAG-AH-194-I05]|nr:heme NO-binding domain-containing protein [Sulfurimonas sp. SAG-AH-194-I05]MDF1874834.1 heme NO-binding domain-containing protein [Sulfurimonas sp. SAG-AH-194-I05]
MKGMVFTELFELVEEKFGYDLLDEVIDASHLENDGSYAATGSYPFEELLRIVLNLSEKTNIPVPTLLEVYGEHLFPKLIKVLPFLDKEIDILDFIDSVENYIHVQVRKLYPDAELPTFEVTSKSDTSLSFNYVSTKNIPQLAKGLILGAAKHFKQPVDVTIGDAQDNKFLITVTKTS